MARNRGKRLFKAVVFVALIALVLGGVGWGVYRFIRPVVTVTKVIEGPLIRAFYATGTISPVREFPIRTNAAGTIVKVLVDKGARVKEGEPLAIVSEPTLEFALDRARAELLEKEQRAAEGSPVLAEFDARLKANREVLEIAQREVGRNQNMVDQNAGTSFDLDRALDRVKQLVGEIGSIESQRASRKMETQRELAVAQAVLKVAQWNVDQQTLRAPADGVVLDRPTSQGTRVAVNEVLMKVADIEPSRLVMRAAVDEEDVTRVRAAQEVQVSLYSFAGRLFTGKVVRIYDQADPSRRTFEIDIALDQPDPLFQPGMTGELAFILERKPNVKIIPTQAIQQNKIYLFRDGKITSIDATPGIVIGTSAIDRTEIIGGLTGDDQIVLSAVSAGLLGKSVRAVAVDPRVAVGLEKKEKASTNTLK